MTLEEIKKGAPKGATHYRLYSTHVRYFKKDNNVWFVYFGEWITCVNSEYMEYSLLFIKPL